MKVYLTPDPVRTASMNTEQLRESFLISNLFKPGQIDMVYCDVDRAVVGSACPVAETLRLGTDDELRAAYFTERRELGILNIGGRGSVSVEGKTFEMDNLDGLYIGRGNKDIRFTSADRNAPAEFYLLSYPAHTTHPTAHAKKAQAAAVNLGSEATCNKRTIYKYIHLDGIKSCQLVMGFTQLQVGSDWNTMPPHTHLRRSEVYLYFNVPAEHRVFHMMGQPKESRHLVVADKQAVISPPWSIHAGVGTSNYTFCWGMGGENQTFDDMDAAPIAMLR
ncbi:MAG TPA: 5-dehydro-4-deoxy-D-glucuronate isomerase [Tepidisphaeraceae bacterium]|nr:5-dehydro-4-deoxy-D-glucuronate isomerase [Tepidisphaeraceae bacterium]